MNTVQIIPVREAYGTDYYVYVGETLIRVCRWAWPAKLQRERANMKTEAEYLRAELIKARGLLAEAVGIFNAAAATKGLKACELAALPTTQQLMSDIAEFRTHGVAVLPEGVKA